MLVAVNPNKVIDEFYSSTMVKKYQNVSLGALPPHVFAIGK